MQQDRSTGWRLGSKRATQFRYQAAGIAMGAVLCVVLAEFFMNTNPVLRVDTFAHPEAAAGGVAVGDDVQVRGRASAASATSRPIRCKALGIGLAHRHRHRGRARVLAASPGYQRFISVGRRGFAIGWIVDAILLASPYASSTGGFLELTSACGSRPAASSARSLAGARRRRSEPRRRTSDALPADMSTTSLMGGGLIAGESLYALGAGMIGLFGSYLRRRGGGHKVIASMADSD